MAELEEAAESDGAWEGPTKREMVAAATWCLRTGVSHKEGVRQHEASTRRTKWGIERQRVKEQERPLRKEEGSAGDAKDEEGEEGGEG